MILVQKKHWRRYNWACGGIRGGSREFLFIRFNAAVKSLAVAIIMSVEMVVGMMSLWGNQDKVCPIQTELVAGIHI